MILQFRLILIVAILLAELHNICGQEYCMKHFMDDKKLNINYISHLVSDSNHNIWIGSNAGLYVFNGQHFIDLTDNLKHPRITFLFKEEDDNNIFVVDGNFNLYRINTKDFKVYREISKPRSKKFEYGITNNLGHFELSPNFKVLKKNFFIDTNLVVTQIDSHPNLKSIYQIQREYSDDFLKILINDGLLINVNNG